MPARRGRDGAGRAALSEERAAQVMRAYLLGELDEADAKKFFEVYEEEIVSRMMRSPDRLSRWAGAMVSASDDEHRQAAQRRLEAAKAWQRRILRENANQPAPETD